MAVDIKMPQLSDTMHSGKILSWKKKEGDKIARGDILAEVETEKANLEIESFHQGTLLKIVIPAQSQAGVGDVIAILGAEGEQISVGQLVSASGPAASDPAPMSPPVSSDIPASSNSTAAPKPQLLPNFPTQASPAGVSSSSADRIKASPLAKKIAAENNVDLSLVSGSGPDGRIVRKDIEQRVGGNAAAKSSPSLAVVSNLGALNSDATNSGSYSHSAINSSGGNSSGGGTIREMSKMRSLISSRMQESVREAPHFYVTAKINMAEAKRLQAALKERSDFAGLSLNHLIIKAAAYALSKEPRVNNAVRNGGIFEPGQINIGIITSVEDGLLIPVIREADKMSLREIAIEARAAVQRAKGGKPTSSDLSGGTFSISNMGMFDVENFTAIINPGQGAVLAVSSTVTEPIISHGQIVIGETMKVTLSVDHRIIDGVMGATFLKFFKESLEMPALLMV